MSEPPLDDAGRETQTFPLRERHPRGGGFVALQSLETVEIEGRVSASGEDGWLSSTESKVSPAASLSKPSEERIATGLDEGLKKTRLHAWLSRMRFAVRLANVLLLGYQVRVRNVEARGFDEVSNAAKAKRKRDGSASAPTGSHFQVQVDASGAAGGSVVVIAKTVTFPRAPTGGKVLAAGGGCFVPSAFSRLGSSSSLTESGLRMRGRKTESVGSDGMRLPACPGGGGGRVAIYSDVAHPLDPAVRTVNERLQH